ncbi:MAG: SPOR domain-containing protein [Azoarcus sp.]|jgi:cell division septation protein DedD|nr:SPOR domain-containing protein [Azoarcus sp.]
MKLKIGPPIDLRQRALTRAGLAMGVALALLLAALWVETGGGPVQPPAEIATKSSAAGNDADYPVFALDAASHETVMHVDDLVTEAVENATVAEIMPAPPEAGLEETTLVPESRPATKMEVPKPAPVDEPHEKPVAKAPPRPLPDGYFVQLGVFDSMDNAKSLSDNVRAIGLSAHIQGRIVVGPFHDKREAEAAKRRLKGIAEGIVLPPRNTGRKKVKLSATKAVSKQSRQSAR